MGVKVTGLNSLLGKLEKLSSPNEVGPALADAVKAGGQLVYDAVEENTPTSTDKWTDKSSALPQGELKRNLYLMEDFEGDRGNPRAIIKFHSDVRHVARWVEKGHRLVRDGKSRILKNGKVSASSTGKVIGFVPGTHFFAEAVESKQAEVRDVVRAKLKQAIDKIANQ